MPIDPDFMKKYPVTGEHNGHAVRGEIKPPEKLGIHGTRWPLTKTSAMAMAPASQSVL
jgi:hypothetical protein